MARGEGRKSRTTGTFGSVDQLATGYRARYYAPDGRRYKAPTLFLSKRDARAWLALRHAEIVAEAWQPPAAAAAARKETRALTLAVYTDTWLPRRKVRGRPLKARTTDHYRQLLDRHILPALGALPLAAITRDDVERWYDDLSAAAPTLRAHCYGLLATVMRSAVAEGKTSLSPCVLRGASTARRVHKPKPATLDELRVIVEHMPDRYGAMVLLAAWAALRFGELTELRRGDFTLHDGDDYGTVHVHRAVVRSGGAFVVGDPKSDAGRRDVELPPHLVPVIREHLAAHTGPEPDALLFPAQSGSHLAPATLYRHFYAARDAARRPDLRWHDLRHSGAVFAAATGATLAELMARLGHSTPAAAMRYQHAAQGRDREIAALLSKIAANGGA